MDNNIVFISKRNFKKINVELKSYQDLLKDIEDKLKEILKEAPHSLDSDRYKIYSEKEWESLSKFYFLINDKGKTESVYKLIQTKDTLSFAEPEKSPRYHKTEKCKFLNKDYWNFKIPEEQRLFILREILIQKIQGPNKNNKEDIKPFFLKIEKLEEKVKRNEEIGKIIWKDENGEEHYIPLYYCDKIRIGGELTNSRYDNDEESLFIDIEKYIENIRSFFDTRWRIFVDKFRDWWNKEIKQKGLSLEYEKDRETICVKTFHYFGLKIPESRIKNCIIYASNTGSTTFDNSLELNEQKKLCIDFLENNPQIKELGYLTWISHTDKKIYHGIAKGADPYELKELLLEFDNNHKRKLTFAFKDRILISATNKKEEPFMCYPQTLLDRLGFCMCSGCFNSHT